MVGEIPVWLDCPPDDGAPNPPVETRTQGLPFNDLSWQNFERLTLRLIRLDNTIADCEIYGTPGQNQSGIDILATPKTGSAKKICYQCKKVETFKAIDIKYAIDQFLDGIWVNKTEEFVLCTTCPIETTQNVKEISYQRDRLAAKGIRFKIWDGAESGRLSEKLKRLPELVDDFFGRSWVEVFNGKDAAKLLGDRLDTGDLIYLRARLKSLYTVLFNQHDPGLRTVGHAPNYLQRYVLADILTQAKVAPPRVESSEKSIPLSPQSQGNLLESGQAISASSISSIYESRRNVFGWINEQKNCVVLGDAGYGKSALLRHIALAMLGQEDGLRGHLGESKLKLLPVWMSFPAFAAAIERKHSTSVQDHFREWIHQNGFDEVGEMFERSLRNSKLLLLVDGLDEATTQSQAQQALDRVAAFAEAVGAEVICTSRPMGFNSLGVPSSWTNAQLAALSDHQISEFSSRWFALTEGEFVDANNFGEVRQRVQGRAEAFLGAVRANGRTHQLARIPLLCQTLIELFRTKPRLPDERQAIYSLIIELLLTSHPDARARAAGTAITLETLGLNLRDIREILIRLAWDMQFEGRVVVESVQHLEHVCMIYLMDEDNGLGLNKGEAKRRSQKIINALFMQFGVLVEKAPNELGFVHLSIQEFLTADAVCRKPEQDQFKWISDIWMQPRWRECLINWFGIQGAQGKKVFIGQAANKIAELGSHGEYERMQALQLRAALVCADLGFPINEARKIILEIIDDLQKSPFIEHRVALAKELTIGALSYGVREECSAFISKFSIGRNSHERASIFSALGTWKPSDDLRVTLLQGLRDEEFVCRLEASKAIAKVFAQSDEMAKTLVDLALYEVRPEVRASALRALGLSKSWTKNAVICALANRESNVAELIFETIRIRIENQLHDEDDLKRMLRLVASETIDYWQKEEFYNVLFEGWSKLPILKEILIKAVNEGRSWTLDDQARFSFLIRAYPGDQAVADVLLYRFKNQKIHFTANPFKIWPLLSTNFRNHPTLTPILRELIEEQISEYSKTAWHPDTVGVFMAVGDDLARKDLIDCYENIEVDGVSRYWIANALSVGWPNDEVVKQTFERWAHSSIELATPIAQFSGKLFEDVHAQRNWLENIIKNAKSRVVQWAYYEIIDKFPDRATWELTSECLKKIKLWYLSKVNIQAKLAAIAPTELESQALFETSLIERNGPPVSSWAASVEHIPRFRSMLLTVAVPASVEVRMAIVSVLRDRVADYENLLRLTPHYLIEESNAVRSTVLLALAQAGRSNENYRPLLEGTFATELDSTGPYHASRTLSAVAGLLELGSASLIVEHFKKTKTTNWASQLINRYHSDPVALNGIVRHWDELLPLLEKHQISTELPFEEIIADGYGRVLEESPSLKKSLDEHLIAEMENWISDEHFINLLSRKFPQSDLLRIILIQSLERGYSRAIVGRKVMRLLVLHFRENRTVLEHISTVLINNRKFYPKHSDGVLGYMVAGWRDSDCIPIISAHLPDDLNSLGFRDRLLILTARGDKAAAELCVRELLNEPLEDWSYNDDINIIREWAAEASTLEVLQEWIKSKNPNLSMTAISILNEQGKVSQDLLESLREQFNQFFNQKITPPDGIDVVFGKSRGWFNTAYSALLHTVEG
ncbi:NACHT domain-containing protein [Methylophilus flavus]|uniref:NACHT domain-containing protein n=1 Tax=Methylophilus flavus TaxID=640084 RepID=A0ABW3PAH1_9PROT